MSNMNLFTWVTIDMVDILNMRVHKSYDMVQYKDQKEGFPLPQSKFGQFLGPCCNNGNNIMNIMTANGFIVPCCTVIPLIMVEMKTPDAKKKHVIFNNLIRKKHKDSMNLPRWIVEGAKKEKLMDYSFISYKDDEVEPHSMSENNVIDINISLVDEFMNAKVLFPQR